MGYMTITIKAGDLVDVLTPLTPATNKDSAGGAFVALEAGSKSLTATASSYARWGDSALAVSKSTNLSAARMKLGRTMVEFRPLVGLAALADSPSDPITLDRVDDGHMVVTTPSFRMKLPAFSAEEAVTSRMNGITTPRFDTPRWADGTTEAWNAPALRGPASFVGRSASADAARPILTNILVEDFGEGKLSLAATDSYRLSVLEIDGEAPPGGPLLIPAGIRGILPSAPSTIKIVGDYPSKWIEWTEGDTTYKSSLTDGTFPNYRGLMPSNMRLSMSISRDRFLLALKRFGKFASATRLSAARVPLVLDITESGVLLSMDDRDGTEFSEFVSCATTGELKVAFNLEYLTSGVKAIEHPTMSLGMIDSQKPAVLSSEGFTFLVMPVRIS